MPDNTIRHVFPIRIGVGVMRSEDLVSLIVEYKIDESEPEVFQQAYAFSTAQANDMARDLQGAVRHLSDMPS